MPRALKVCSQPGCPTLTPQGRCDTHRRAADRARGTATQRGYTSRGHQTFRAAVLRRDPICRCTAPDCGHGPACWLPSTVADHHPRSRRELLAAGLNPNDPAHGRGLCKGCHDRHTSRAQPGGWHAR